MVLRAALAGRAREAVGHIVPSQEAEREEYWLSPLFVQSGSPGYWMVPFTLKMGFFPSHINSSGNSLLRDRDVSLRLTQNTAS